MFDLFRNVAKRRLKNVYRFFYNQKTQEPYEALRHQYLYKQGDPVNGIFCILSGQVKRIKESYESQNLQRNHQLEKSPENVNNSSELRKNSQNLIS